MNVWYRAFALIILVGVTETLFLITEPASIFAEEVSFGVVENRQPSTAIPQTDTELPLGKNTIFFFGDVMLARDVERKISRSGSSFPFIYTEIPKNNAYAVANFESAIPKVHSQTPNNTFRFSTKDEFLPALHEAGFTHVSLANNHAFDAGSSGYNNTITKLWENDIIPFGHPTVVSSSSVTFMELGSSTVAVVALHTLFSKPNEASVANVLAYAAELSDKQIVYIHWGEEYVSLQNESQREYAKFLIAAGADMIVGHHPHVVQGIELIEQVPVFYSLGNYIFDQYFSTEVQTGLVLSLTTGEGLQVALLPVTSVENRTQPRPMDEAHRADFLKKLSTLSTTELSEQILAGQLIF